MEWVGGEDVGGQVAKTRNLVVWLTWLYGRVALSELARLVRGTITPNLLACMFARPSAVHGLVTQYRALTVGARRNFDPSALRNPCVAFGNTPSDPAKRFSGMQIKTILLVGGVCGSKIGIMPAISSTYL